MIKRSVLTLAILAAGGFTPLAAMEPQQANPPGECKAVEHTAGQQEVVPENVDADTEKKAKTAADINKEIVAEMMGEKKPETTASVDSKSSPAAINQQIVENAKQTDDGKKVAATGEAKPTENWFGCPPEKAPEEKATQ